MSIEITKFDIKQIKVIVGLGNTGLAYENTRHNVGFEFVDIIKQKFKVNMTNQKKFQGEIGEIKQFNIKILKPTTMMNLSGQSVQAVTRFFKISPNQILIIHDDLDIKLGESKLSFRKGPKVHNGVNNIEKLIHSKNFWRLRIGVENRSTETRKFISGADYVLMKMSDEDRKTLQACLNVVLVDIFYSN
jgi:PTH1 family peptidyl-tRNA hydrolase